MATSITSLCDEILQQFQLNTKKNPELVKASNAIFGQFICNKIKLDKALDPILALERAILLMSGQHKMRIEENIFSALRLGIEQYYAHKSTKKRPRLDAQLIDTETNPKKKQEHEMALKIVQFAEEIFAHNISRDAFNSERKASALALINELDTYYDIPQYEPLLQSAFNSGKERLMDEATACHQNHLARQNRSFGQTN